MAQFDIDWYQSTGSTIRTIYLEELFREPEIEGWANWFHHAREGGKDAEWIREAVRATPEWAEVHAPHFDPTTVSLETLARFKGDMWPLGLGLPLGPRPGSPDNVIATDFFNNYSPEDQTRILAWEKERGYTHVVMGPIVDSDGYHGVYRPNDWRGKFDEFLDIMERFWDNGQAPVVFIKPDNWTLAQTQELTPLFTTERAQKLMRIIVPAGWEPTKYGWSSQTWAAFGAWARQTWPNALICLHTVCDVDAPVGTDAWGDDNGKSNDQGWARVAPYYHVWLSQSCAFSDPNGHGDPNHPDRTNFQNWQDLYRRGLKGSYIDRFENGYAGWPTFSAWGYRGIIPIPGEFSAYWKFWQARPQAEADSWGNAAVAAGAAGYLDGGTVPVP